MTFNILTTTIRGYHTDLTTALKIDTIQNRLDFLIYDKIIKYLIKNNEVYNVCRFNTRIYGGIQGFFDYFESSTDTIDSVLIYTTENSNKYNLRETNFILDYLFVSKIPTVVISLKDDGTFIEALTLIQDPTKPTGRSFSKLILD